MVLLACPSAKLTVPLTAAGYTAALAVPVAVNPDTSKIPRRSGDSVDIKVDRRTDIVISHGYEVPDIGRDGDVAVIAGVITTVVHQVQFVLSERAVAAGSGDAENVVRAVAGTGACATRGD